MKISKVFQGIGLLLIVIGFLWILITPTYTITTSANEDFVNGNTTTGIISAQLNAPYAVIMVIFGLMLSLLAMIFEGSNYTLKAEKVED